MASNVALNALSTCREEATSPEQRDRQRYVEEIDVHTPSMITLNAVAAVAAAQAANDYLIEYRRAA